MKLKIKSAVITTIAATMCVGSFASTKHTANANVRIDKMQHKLAMMDAKIGRLKTQVRRTNKQSVDANKNISVYGLPSKIFNNINARVTSGPYPINKKIYNNGSTLIVSSPDINQDAKLLLRRYSEVQQYKKKGLSAPVNPRLVLGGKIEAQAIGDNSYDSYTYSDIDVSGIGLDAYAELSPWVNGLLSFKYDNTQGAHNRVGNSNVLVDKAFITFGNFAKSGFYGSIGQMYVPFGRYNSVNITDPLTKFIGKTKVRAIAFGYEDTVGVFQPYVSVFAFNGDSEYGNSKIVHNYGGDLGVSYNKNKLISEFGVSYIANIADSDNMQNPNGAVTMSSPAIVQSNTGFAGGVAQVNEQLEHRVAGISGHANITYGKFNFLAECLSALQAFDASDLSFYSAGNAVLGAKPKAFDVEGAYAFRIGRHPSSFGVGYGRSYQAVALGIPQQQYLATLAVTVLDNTVAKLEFAHKINYGKDDRAGFSGVDTANTQYLGKNDNVLTAQIGVYF